MNARTSIVVTRRIGNSLSFGPQGLANVILVSNLDQDPDQWSESDIDGFTAACELAHFTDEAKI